MMRYADGTNVHDAGVVDLLQQHAGTQHLYQALQVSLAVGQTTVDR